MFSAESGGLVGTAQSLVSSGDPPPVSSTRLGPSDACCCGLRRPKSRAGQARSSLFRLPKFPFRRRTFFSLPSQSPGPPQPVRPTISGFSQPSRRDDAAHRSLSWHAHTESAGQHAVRHTESTLLLPRSRLTGRARDRRISICHALAPFPAITNPRATVPFRSVLATSPTLRTAFALFEFPGDWCWARGDWQAGRRPEGTFGLAV
jgi:hypothetical protein